MDLRKLLRSVPVTRRNTPFLYAALSITTSALLGLALAIYEVVVEGYPLDVFYLLYPLLFGGIGLVFGLIILLCFLPMQRQVKLALKKADYMQFCISKLSRSQQDLIESEISNLDKTWRSKTYLTSQVVTPPKFGKYCLYGKIATQKTFGINQHVILPYQNIIEVIASEPERSTSKAARITNNALSIASVVLSAVSDIGGGAVTFIEKRPTVAIIDDVGYAYQIDCTDTDSFLEKLAEQTNGATEMT